MKTLLIKISLMILTIITVSCSSETYTVGTIKIKGSDTMLPLTEMLAEEYMKNHPGISIYVSGGGTTSGIKSLINGEIDICTASRNLNAGEAKTLAEYYGTIGMFFLVAKDALSVYVNEKNPVKNFTAEELAKIFSCEITNWKELGGNDEPVKVIIRPPNSGTHQYFREHILDEREYCHDAVIMPTTDQIIEEVSDSKNAIGYGGIGFQDDVIHASINGVAPSEDNARNDKYPLTRYLHFFTSKTPKGNVKEFIDWVLSPDGQKIIKASGYIPLWEISF
ncbi:MAG: phosphate ABC transporter substrate-binding protein [Melioribacteraceae bacterium]|nr:phosphate ABC transporter substrate-binding protein [Melioribacteraceae bacterium]MCF8353324.1 phosphate ABC transporter substrate-binding protein [Melioribacteraceae bacterium]MCF8393188.1 phosphate ABC transporter substrate-binding protein [Melioribacteraceae bacterium]MCF8419050.1 phosphate ABC transporter substrate-binding protein [Melioribacteraceae bacterium]